MRVKTIFWNSDQHRLRACWRLIGQLIIATAIALPSQIGLGIVALMIFSSQSGISEPGAMQGSLLGSPLLMTLSTLGVLVALLASVWLAGRILDRRPFADFGFHLGRNWWIDLGFGLFLGAFLMLLIFLVELAAGWVTVSGTFVTRNPDVVFPVAILPAIVTFLAVGFYEELFSRGYQLRNMAEGLNWKAIGPRGAILLATLLSSAVFGLLHVFNPNASFVSTFNIFVAGALVLGIGYLLTGELAIPMGVHITWNFFQGNVFGFPVSGGDFRWATFVGIQQGGPDLWTGGAFGPEAGLLGLGAILLGGALTALWVRWRYGRVGLHLALAEAPKRPEKDAANYRLRRHSGGMP
jgi:membrane protease YdiL (CAAX protease family)